MPSQRRKQLMTEYKTGKGFNYFDAKFLQEVLLKIKVVYFSTIKMKVHIKIVLGIQDKWVHKEMHEWRLELYVSFLW
jgi:hypothetical protein